jgi:5-methylcytosine-specific restriction endonuclease McrA
LTSSVFRPILSNVRRHPPLLSSRHPAYGAYHEKARGLRHAKGSRRRAREHSAAGTYTARQFHALCESSSWRCSYCPAVLDAVTAQADHVIPLSRGGSNSIENIAVSCRSCNASKNNTPLDVWLSRRKKVDFRPAPPHIAGAGGLLDMKARDAQIVDAYSRGDTFATVAKTFCLSRERVRQIVTGATGIGHRRRFAEQMDEKIIAACDDPAVTTLDELAAKIGIVKSSARQRLIALGLLSGTMKKLMVRRRARRVGHGTTTRYRRGCRCDSCRLAHTKSARNPSQPAA